MRIPWAYLHPRFQGQEPPGFPGRFNLRRRQSLRSFERVVLPSQDVRSSRRGGLSGQPEVAG
ncbi:hypothetical protein CRM90_29535 [Mycobacterium sp. ENV421]|nr:hypothetical protein CRM90_29535 [Mycobacterium sp. ENV421]